MTILTKLSCEDFLTKLASEEPTPGGGGAAAAVGAVAASLASMVANLTVGKEKFAAQEPEVRKLLQEAELLRRRLLDLVEKDASVFDSFMSCYRLPKATAEEKAARSRAICAAAKNAAEVPFAAAQACLEVQRLAVRLIAIGNPNVITDGTVSAILARAAMRSEFYNVYINLLLIKDEDYNSSLKMQIKAMEEEAKILEEQALKATDAALV